MQIQKKSTGNLRNKREGASVSNRTKPEEQDVIYKPVLQKSNSFQSKRRSGSDTAPVLENSPADVELPTYSERSLTPDSGVSNSNGQENTTELNKAVQPDNGDAMSYTSQGHVELKLVLDMVWNHPSTSRIMCRTDSKKENHIALFIAVKCWKDCFCLPWFWLSFNSVDWLKTKYLDCFALPVF